MDASLMDEALPVIPIDPDYGRAVDACLTPRPKLASGISFDVTEEQVLFAQHLLSMLRKLPRSHVLAFTAGRLLDLLEAIPGGGCSPPVEGSGFGPVLRREYPQGSAPRSSAASAVESTYRARQKLPKGEPRRRIELFLDGREAPQSATDIATATGLALSSVANVLEGGGFERDKTNRMLWRLRAVGAIPLSSPEP